MFATNEFLYKHISTNATTLVKTGEGFLHSISVNTAGGTDTATVYDSITGSGTIIGILSCTTPTTHFLDVGFATGLTIVTAGSTAPSITVSYA